MEILETFRKTERLVRILTPISRRLLTRQPGRAPLHHSTAAPRRAAPHARRPRPGERRREAIMALVYPDLQLLIAAREGGARYDRIATLGRLKLFLHPGDVQDLARAGAAGALLDQYAWGDWCERYLVELLGAREVVSFDASAHEAATRVMDLNRDLSPQHEEGFDLVIDGGTLEHVFNYPVAVSNLMRMAQVGGRVLTANPCNNLAGHGFYQFTPELLFRVFSRVNGFTVEQMLLTEHRHASVELAPPMRIVQVRDPAEVGCRVMITSGRCLMIRCLSRRTHAIAPFATAPQQSDYQVMWRGGSAVRTVAAAAAERGRALSMLRSLYRKLPGRLRTQVAERRLNYSLSNRAFFRPWDQA
jgi:hypothetical protein